MLAFDAMHGKGSDIGPETGVFVSLFHPRHQRWDDHFLFRVAVIDPLT
jgi:hypothetical protein